MNKPELLTLLQDAGLPADDSMTKAQLEEMQKKAKADGVFDGEQSAEEAAETPEVETAADSEEVSDEGPTEEPEEPEEEVREPSTDGQYEVVHSVKVGGTLYLAGERVDVPAEDASELLSDGVIK